MRSTLNWCFGPDGDIEVGAEVAIASAIIWFQLSLVVEARTYFELAAAALEPAEQVSPSREVSLLTALGTALIHILGPGPETRLPSDCK